MTYPAIDLEAIQRELPDKSINEIRHLIDSYSKQGYNKQRRLEAKCDDECPLDLWINILQKNKSNENSNAEVVPRVLKYIALFEKKHHSNVSLRDCYLALSDMCRDVAPVEMDDKTSYFLCKSVKKLAEHMQQEDIRKDKDYARKINSAQIVTPIVRTYLSKRQLSKNVNPLKIPENMLKKRK